MSEEYIDRFLFC